jgi:hypothetical protein
VKTAASISAAKDLNTILNEAIPAWVELTGTKLGTNSYTVQVNSQSEFQSYDLKKYVDELNDARTLDMSGTTAILLLRGLFEDYVAEKSVSASALLRDPGAAETLMKGLRAFHAQITTPACEEAVTSFKETLRDVAVHYGYDVSSLKKHLANERQLGELRLAASRSLDRLSTHQFTQGLRDAKPLQYNREIFEFSNINSFVHALHRQMVAGITLALIRPEDVYQAYFVLGLRNGETVTILTDFAEGAHPEYHNMTRRPDRRLEERSRQHWFPYRLLDDDAVKRKKQKTALVAIDAKAHPIEKITNLNPSEFIWLTLLFDLITAKFDRDDYKTPELSYTAAMVVAPHELVDASHALVQSGRYAPLVLEPLTPTTATPELADTEKPNGYNAWLEERYRDRVPAMVLDVVGQRRALEVGKAASKLLPRAIKEEKLPSLRKQRGVFGRGPDYRLKPLEPLALDPTYFGTRKEIERNRAWYARNNLIKAVQLHATAEFAAKHEMILSWYRKRLERNMAALWKAVAMGELIAPSTVWASRDGHDDPFPSEDTLRWKEENIVEQKQGKRWHDAFGWARPGISFGGWNADRRDHFCALDPSLRANIFTDFQPDNSRALALLMGIPEKKIPWPLQHWTTLEPYTGNSILRRIDPQDSRLDDPWRHLDLRVTIFLSKRSYNRVCKEHGITPRELETTK